MLSEELSLQILERLEQGESPLKLSLEFSDNDEASELIDDYCLMQSQSIEVAPSEAGLQNVLNQAVLLNTQTGDEEEAWGMFSRITSIWKWGTPVALALLIFTFGISDWMQPETKNLSQATINPAATNSTSSSRTGATVDEVSNGETATILADTTKPEIQIAKAVTPEPEVFKTVVNQPKTPEYKPTPEVANKTEETLVEEENTNTLDEAADTISTPELALETQGTIARTETVAADAEMGQMAAEWQSAFENELADFYQINQEIESMNTETLFSLVIRWLV